MDIILFPLLSILNSLLGIYVWLVIGHVLLSWLIQFNVINNRNNFVRMVVEFLATITEPLLSRIRRILPTLGGFDLSPFVLIVILWFLQGVLSHLMIKLFMVGSIG